MVETHFFYCSGNFLSATLPGTPIAHQLVVSIRQKCTPEEVINVLKDLPHPLEIDGDMSESTYNPLKIDVFVQTLLNLGSKSFSHSFAAISKFHSVFKVHTHTHTRRPFNICLSIEYKFNYIFRIWPTQRSHKFVYCTICLNCGTPINK